MHTLGSSRGVDRVATTVVRATTHGPFLRYRAAVEPLACLLGAVSQDAPYHPVVCGTAGLGQALNAVCGAVADSSSVTLDLQLHPPCKSL